MADTFNIDPAELDKVLAQVEQDLAPVLKNEARRLAKAKDEGSEGGPDEGSAPAEGEEPAPPAEGSAPPAGPGPEGSAPPAGPEGSAPPAGPEGSAPPGGPEGSAPGGMPQDPAAIAQMVQSLPPEILKTVYLAAKQALFAQMGGGPEGSTPPAGPPAGPGPEGSAPPAGPPAGPEASAGGSPAFKNEMAASPGNGGKSAPVQKSEQDIQALVKAEMANATKAYEAQIDLLTRAVTKLAGTPIRKAVTGVSHIAKSEQERKPLSKTEVNAKLKEKVRGNLAKKDREAINRFYDSGANDITIVAHLLTE